MYKYQESIYNAHKYAWNCTDSTDIYKVYNNPSVRKTRAFFAIWTEKMEHNGYEFCIVSHNSMVFTCAYKYDVIDKNTGEFIETRLVYHTPTKRIEFAI